MDGVNWFPLNHMKKNTTEFKKEILWKKFSFGTSWYFQIVVGYMHSCTTIQSKFLVLSKEKKKIGGT